MKRIHRGFALIVWLGLGALSGVMSLSAEEASYQGRTLGPDAKDAVPALIETLGHPDWITRRTAAAALGRVGPAAKDAAPVVAETAVRDVKGDVRRVARFALTLMGPEARQATVPLLHELAT
jgi:HEAT repeat protein